MNIQQLEYIIAVDKYRHFSKAADECFVTQPTLSMMIHKLEEELNTIIFDRSVQPIVTTESGIEIVEKARKILLGIEEIKELTINLKNKNKGEIKIGVIPTVAPFLLPFFLKKFISKYPDIKLKIAENITDQIIEKLEKNILDIGIVASPLNDPSISEFPLYTEELVIFASPGEKVLLKRNPSVSDITINHLWLLEEGHCLRSQIINLCESRKKSSLNKSLEYTAGSIDSLIKLVEQNDGITIVPELAVLYMNKKQKNQIRHFKSPAPVRQISLITYKHFYKSRMLEILKEEITTHLKSVLPNNKSKPILLL
jgi:LysR family transcriptional regulator, hydrogen peroxide-inducible genes activator